MNRTRFRGTELSAAVKSSEVYMVYVAEIAMVCLKCSRSSEIVFFEKTIEELRLRGIAFSLTEAFDTTTAQGRPVIHMFGALAESERSLIRERPLAGLAAAHRAGCTGGRR